jgi:predicted nucleic acid binding AN1-type Zn finger protein
MLASGTPCDFSECTDEVYLRSECAQCHKKFCERHAAADRHRCPFLAVSHLRTVVCPACSVVLRVETGESLDHAINSHIDGGACRASQRTAAASLYGFGAPSSSSSASSSSSRVAAGGAPQTLCGMAGCNRFEAVSVHCAHCGKDFCLAHKMPEHHACQKLRDVRPGGGGPPALSSAAAGPTPTIAGTSGRPSQPSRARTVADVLFQAENTRETAVGIRPGRLPAAGDVLVLALYDGARLRRPAAGLKPVLFSVSPVTPVGRLLDAAVDFYPALSKTLEYCVFVSVAVSDTSAGMPPPAAAVGSDAAAAQQRQRRHLLRDQNRPIGDIVTEAAALGGVFPATSEPLTVQTTVEGAGEGGRPGPPALGTSGVAPALSAALSRQVVLAMCVSVIAARGGAGSGVGEMTRSDTEYAVASTLAPALASSTDGAASEPPPVEMLACAVRPFTDAKGKPLPVLVDRATQSQAFGAATSKAVAGKASADACSPSSSGCQVQ